jgi:hypothetical protein
VQAGVVGAADREAVADDGPEDAAAWQGAPVTAPSSRRATAWNDRPPSSERAMPTPSLKVCQVRKRRPSPKASHCRSTLLPGLKRRLGDQLMPPSVERATWRVR